ncbi:Lrp/AsnC family transcriptional regulator [Aquamicrobium terrae]|uniref:Lrp/AsnC family leucine-responsive transcriptional regulator n=1 Tax=Aquamicrobium terrae TaxID=1324945 RepID=A0ABV2N5L9_9HYPH
MKRLGIENGALDAVDARIVALLADNARIPTAELARSVGLSAPSVAERLRRLEDSGVIEGYMARIAPAAIGYPVSAWLRVRPVPGELKRVAEIIRSIPEITECDRITGEDCFLARVRVASVADLERLLDQLVPYAMTNTAIVQSSPVLPRLPPLAPAA